jgi:tRNA (adenine57-N1/adenine58-N1)-methyltransferase
VAAFCGDVPNWRIVVTDAARCIEERDVDRLILDVPDPVPILDAAAAALRSGGFLIGYLPTILQVKDLRDAIRDDERFAAAETLEVLERMWHVEGRSVRPSHRMVAHTAFLTFARRTADAL